MGDKEVDAFVAVAARLTQLRAELEPDERAALDAIVAGDEAAEVRAHAMAAQFDPAMKITRVDKAYKVAKLVESPR